MILRWDPMRGRLVDEQGRTVSNGIVQKARDYIRNNCVIPEPDGSYTVVQPPNSRRYQTHRVVVDGDRYVCDCQGFHMRGICSHVVAVAIYRNAIEQVVVR